ncbi:GNAT family N-acetyltransferase [Thermoflavimicrobium daqui]|uniref:GNAT family N-acetyltransferase n=1 Tax=Thermoflavimicrobium daqui TaxID=2137476 RepID=A0A364K468_9BACL|nr:GNAT family protein [Thermoflavimicrobium daqui]RAL24146.1 GNAT family N-acetyltransferase [Thermoflavimicrobium daqui]
MKIQAPVSFLEGKKIYLHQVSIEDTDLYFQFLFDPEVRKLTGIPNTFTREQVRQYIRSKTKDTTSLLLLIAQKGSNTVIGDIALHNIDTVNRSANIRVFISDEQNQEKGYEYEVLNLVLEYGFGILKLHRMELNVFSYNEKVLHVFKKIGFQKEEVHNSQRYRNSVIMSILGEKYRELKSSNDN